MDDTRFDLIDMLQHPGLKPLLDEIDELSRSVENDVIKLDMGTPNAERELLYRKLRAEGSHKLRTLIRTRIHNLLKPPKRG